MNIISVTDITKTYTERKLFEKASFYLQEREKVGVIGINGTGKSTLLKIAAGIEEPDEGQVIRANHIVVRYLPQNPVFDPELSVIDTVLAQSSQNFVGGTSEQNQNAGNHAEHVEQWNLESDAKAMMTKLGITNFEQKAGELSGGQRKRLALVAALLVPCDVLILDEPTSYLDMGFKMDILTNIRMLARDKKMAVIMSLHELDLAQKVSDTIACVRGDRIDCVGTPEEIFAGNYVQELYGVADQSFDPVTGQIFLCTGHEKAVVSRDFSAENCSGKNFGCGKKNPDPVSPQFFVIGGAGSGIPVYNRLWRENIPFAAGILQENDVEYKAAVALASEVVAEKAFYPVGQDKVQAAKRLIDSCKKCICAVEEFGPLNESNRELAEYARRIGKTGKNI